MSRMADVRDAPLAAVASVSAPEAPGSHEDQEVGQPVVRLSVVGDPPGGFGVQRWEVGTASFPSRPARAGCAAGQRRCALCGATQSREEARHVRSLRLHDRSSATPRSTPTGAAVASSVSTPFRETSSLTQLDTSARPKGLLLWRFMSCTRESKPRDVRKCGVCGCSKDAPLNLRILLLGRWQRLQQQQKLCFIDAELTF